MLVVIPMAAIRTKWSGWAASTFRYTAVAFGTCVEFLTGDG
jgi:hypothetical protein